MQPAITIGITDCAKYINYEQWFLHAPEHVHVIRLSAGLNNADDVQRCDGIVLTGGEDVHPARYHQPELMEELNPALVNEARDAFEWQVIEKTFAAQKPLLGICRGLQVMNVYLGGTLVHDIPSVKKITGHSKRGETDERHAITIVPSSLLHQVTQQTTGEVNSAHHQAAGVVAGELVVSASAASSIPEALEWSTPKNKTWLLLVQWHPERMADQDNPFASRIRTAFLNAIIQ